MIKQQQFTHTLSVREEQRSVVAEIIDGAKCDIVFLTNATTGVQTALAAAVRAGKAAKGKW